MPVGMEQDALAEPEPTLVINVQKSDYNELIRRLHEAEKMILLANKDTDLFKSIKALNPKKVTMEF